jgi:multidrug efflux system membrane fusion protein
MLDTPTTPTESQLETPGSAAKYSAPVALLPAKTAAPAVSASPENSAASDTTKHEQTRRTRRTRWLWLSLAVLALLGIVLYFLWPTITGAKAKAAAIAAKGPAPIQVVTTTATKGNIGVYYTGLGAVTPLATVTVRSVVSGQLMTVHFKEGDLVQKGDLLIEIDPRPFQAVVVQIEGQLIRDQALLANAHVDLDRYADLIKSNAIPEQQYATQLTLVTQDEGIVRNDQGLLDAAKLNVTYSRIVSPVAGIVGLRLVDPGNIVQSSDTNGMVVITQIQPISVIFPVGEDQIPSILRKLRAGQSLPVDAWDRELKNKLASGTLSTADNEIDQTTGTLKLRASFDNANRALFPNQFVNARLLEQEKTGVTLLPSAAIQRNTNDTYAYLVKPDSTVTVRIIKTGTTEGDQTEITSGLSPGDKVVMTGVDKLQEGSKVAVGASGVRGSSGANGAKGSTGIQ